MTFEDLAKAIEQMDDSQRKCGVYVLVEMERYEAELAITFTGIPLIIPEVTSDG